MTDMLMENKKLLDLATLIDYSTVSEDEKRRLKIQVFIKTGNLTKALILSNSIKGKSKSDLQVGEFIENTLSSIEKIFSINIIN